MGPAGPGEPLAPLGPLSPFRPFWPLEIFPRRIDVFPDRLLFRDFLNLLEKAGFRFDIFVYRNTHIEHIWSRVAP
jgi:hypothetical protein